MLQFSFSTVLMASLASIAVAAISALVLSNKHTMACAGHKILIAFIGFAFLRLLFPFEFPFTANALLPKSFSKAVFFFRQTRATIMGCRISLWHIFAVIWVIGIVIGLDHYVRSYRHAKDYILKYGRDKTTDDRYKAILDLICQQNHIPNTFRIVELQGLNVPIILGGRHPYIILPGHLSIPDDTLYYIFLHEVLHHVHHSFLIKGIIHLISILYWWNPVRLLLCYCSNLLLEMHIDSTLTHNDQDITQKYAACLLYMKKETEAHPAKLPSYLQKETPSFARVTQDDLWKRTMNLLLHVQPWKKIAFNTVLTALVVGISVWSYVFILEAYYTPPHFKETYAEPTIENAYFIINDECGYDLYIGNKYFDTITNLNHYKTGIKIYDKEGVLINENE